MKTHTNNQMTRRIAVLALIFIAIVAIAMVVAGGYVFWHVIAEKQFWFNLSNLSPLAQNSIMLLTGYVGGGALICTGISILIRLIGVEKIINFFSSLMDWVAKATQFFILLLLQFFNILIAILCQKYYKIISKNLYKSM